MIGKRIIYGNGNAFDFDHSLVLMIYKE